MAESYNNEDDKFNGLSQSNSTNNADYLYSARLDIVDLQTTNDHNTSSSSPDTEDRCLLPIDLCSGLDEHRTLNQQPSEIISFSPSSVRERPIGASAAFNACDANMSHELTQPECNDGSKFTNKYPLHWHVWHNDLQQLSVQLDIDSVSCFNFYTVFL